MTAEFTTTPLFGGAITALLPNGFIDASDLRQIPDNQEVFLSPTSNASLIISLLERVAAPGIVEALQYHFEDAVLGAENRQGANADVPLVKSVEQIAGPNGAAFGGEAAQAGVMVAAMQTDEHERARQRTKGVEEVVFTGIVMGVVRLRQKETDVLVEFHVPHVVGQYDESGVELGSKHFGPLVNQAQEAALKVITSFNVVDWNLFGS